LLPDEGFELFAILIIAIMLSHSIALNSKKREMMMIILGFL